MNALISVDTTPAGMVEITIKDQEGESTCWISKETAKAFALSLQTAAESTSNDST